MSVRIQGGIPTVALIQYTISRTSEQEKADKCKDSGESITFHPIFMQLSSA